MSILLGVVGTIFGLLAIITGFMHQDKNDSPFGVLLIIIGVLGTLANFSLLILYLTEVI